MIRRTAIRAAASACAGASLALLTVAPGASAGGFGGTTTLRTAAGGTELRASDLAAKGDNVVAAWEEHPGGGGKVVYLRWSTNGGASFAGRRRLDDRPQREVQVDTCRDWAWAISGLHDPEAPAGEWLIVLDGRALHDPYYEAGLLSFGGTGRNPDIACAGNKRLATAWFQKNGGGSYHVKFFSRGVLLQAKGDNPPEVSLDLGTGEMGKGLSVAATPDRIHLAWFQGDDLRYKRFDVGSGPDFHLTPHATVTLATLPEAAFTPRLGAEGDRVVLAYTKKADLVARVSTNGGASFGTVRTLLNVPFPSEVAAYATNAAVKGARIIVSGTVIGGDFELSGEGFIYRTTNDGGAWARVPGSTKDGGHAVGAYAKPGATPRVVEIWDQWIDDPVVEHLRFQRES